MANNKDDVQIDVIKNLIKTGFKPSWCVELGYISKKDYDKYIKKYERK